MARKKRRKKRSKRNPMFPDSVMIPAGLFLNPGKKRKNPSFEAKIPPWAWLAGALALVWVVRRG